jgi:cytochrome c biogenesis protein CcdA
VIDVKRIGITIGDLCRTCAVRPHVDTPQPGCPVEEHAGQKQSTARVRAIGWTVCGVAIATAIVVALIPPADPASAQSAGTSTDAPAPIATVTAVAPSRSVTLTLFHGADCPHCADERPFLVGLQHKYPGLVLDEYEVWYDAENLAMLRATAAEMGFNPSGTPVTIIGDRHWIGFNEAIARAMDETVSAALAGTTVADTSTALLEVPFLGAVDVAHSSLVVSALVIGFVDGVNPCSLWVLSVLLAIVLHSGSRGRVVSVGLTFLAVTVGMYAIYMAGMYSALDYIGKLAWIRLTIATVALVFGLIHMKEYFWFKEGPSLTIDDARKPGLYKRMRSIARADKSLPAVLGGTVVLAVGVSLLETPCTAGLPLLWTSMLASQGVGLATAAALFAIYMAVFLADELVVFGVAVATLRSSRLGETQGRQLKLISGSVMVTLAVAMFAMPQAMETVTGTVQVFAAASLMVAAVWALERVAVAARSSRRRA